MSLPFDSLNFQTDQLSRFEGSFSPKNKDAYFAESLVEPFRANNDLFSSNMFGQGFDLPWNTPAISNLSRGIANFVWFNLEPSLIDAPMKKQKLNHTDLFFYP